MGPLHPVNLLRKLELEQMAPEPKPLGVPATYDAALRGIMDRDFLKSERYQAQQWRANREGAHPKIIEFETALVKRMRDLGVPMFAHCVVRTPAEQDAAFVLGHTQRKGSDPFAHRFAAVDVIHSTRAWDIPEKAWDLVGHVGMEISKRLSIPVVWGGDWDGDGDKTDQKLYDPAHWELAFWSSMEPTPPFMYLHGRHPKG